MGESFRRSGRSDGANSIPFPASNPALQILFLFKSTSWVSLDSLSSFSAINLIDAQFLIDGVAHLLIHGRMRDEWTYLHNEEK